jgi:hypothetical protein
MLNADPQSLGLSEWPEVRAWPGQMSNLVLELKDWMMKRSPCCWEVVLRVSPVLVIQGHDWLKGTSGRIVY